MKTAIVAILLCACTADAKAPEVAGQKWIVRAAYIHDVQVAPFDKVSRCEVTRAFTEKELPPMPGYVLVVRCLPIGGN